MFITKTKYFIKKNILAILLFNSVSDQVETPVVSNESSSGFLISWSPPQHPNGKITGYVIEVSVGNVTYAYITTTCINDAETEVCTYS